MGIWGGAASIGRSLDDGGILYHYESLFSVQVWTLKIQSIGNSNYSFISSHYHDAWYHPPL